jgi:hypothetical protein
MGSQASSTEQSFFKYQMNTLQPNIITTTSRSLQKKEQKTYEFKLFNNDT